MSFFAQHLAVIARKNSAPPSGPTTLLTEGFEGTDNGGYETVGWTTLGDANPNSTSNVYAGSQCLVTDASTGGARSPDFAASANVTAEWTSYISALATADRPLTRFMTSAGAAEVGGLWMHSGGQMFLKHGTITKDTGLSLSATTRYFFRLVLTKSTGGSNGFLSLQYNTTGFTFGAVDDSMANGDSTDDTVSFQISGFAGASQPAMFTDAVLVTTP